MHHVGIAFDHHQVLELHGAWLANPAQIVAGQVHQHDMLGAFLGVRQQLLGQRCIGCGIRAAAPGAGNGPQRGQSLPVLPLLHLDHHLGAGADELPVPEIEVGHIGAGIHQPEAAVDRKGFMGQGGLQALAEHQLERVSGHDVFPGLMDRRFEGVHSPTCRRVGPGQGSREPGQPGRAAPRAAAAPEGCRSRRHSDRPARAAWSDHRGFQTPRGDSWPPRSSAQHGFHRPRTPGAHHRDCRG